MAQGLASVNGVPFTAATQRHFPVRRSGQNLATPAPHHRGKSIQPVRFGRSGLCGAEEWGSVEERVDRHVKNPINP